MKNITKMLIVSILVVSLSACTKEGLRGPAGPAGETGVRGPKGDIGFDGMGNANVLKYSFTVEKSAWVLEDEGEISECLAYEVTPANINNVDLDAADYAIFAYARPSTGNSHRKMLPFSYNHNGTPLTTIRIDLVISEVGENLKVTARKITISGNNQVSSAPNQTNDEMADNIVFDIFLIKQTDPDEAQNMQNIKNISYDDLNKIYIQSVRD